MAGLTGFTSQNYNTAPGLPYPGFNSITLSENEANTHYNGLQMDLNSQLSHGAGTFNTWNHTQFSQSTPPLAIPPFWPIQLLPMIRESCSSEEKIYF